jgi:glyoxylase-like metal-dependent hydrolase (beta-lactamase superfamily II)
VLDHDRIYRLSLRGVNAYLVDDGGDWTLVDAGTPWDASRVRDGLAEAGLAARDLSRVLLTHYDLDHVGTLAALDLAPDAEVRLADPDAAQFEGAETPPLANHKGALQRATRFLLSLPDVPITRVADGDRIGGFTAHRTPGHTPGHTAFVHADLGAAFVGDLVTGDDDGSLDASPWLVCYDVDGNAASIRSFAERAPDVDVVAMGHGEPVRTGGGRALRALADRV